MNQLKEGGNNETDTSKLRKALVKAVKKGLNKTLWLKHLMTLGKQFITGAKKLSTRAKNISKTNQENPNNLK